MKKTLLTALIIVSLSTTNASAETIAYETRTQIIDAITAIAAGVDRHDWARVRAALADTVTTDYTGLWGGDPVTQKADELVSQWSSFLPGFEITQHLVTNHSITSFDTSEATAEADFQATHRIGKTFWVLGGRYDYKLVKTRGHWFLTSITMIPIWETGDRDLVKRAGERAKTAQ